MPIDEATKDYIREELVLTRLTNSFELVKINEEFYVLLQGVILPYRIFVATLMRYGLWNIKFSKTDWFLINRDIYDLWKEVDIVPDGVIFDINRGNKMTAPIVWVKQALKSIDFDKDVLDFFSVRSGDDLEGKAQYEALLYLAEEKYAALANK